LIPSKGVLCFQKSFKQPIQPSSWLKSPFQTNITDFCALSLEEINVCVRVENMK